MTSSIKVAALVALTSASAVAGTSVMAQDGDWTGPYVGLSFGSVTADLGAADQTEQLYGGFAGYDYDLGQWVVGAELEFQKANDLTLGGTEIEDFTRLKLRGGYDLGNTLVYATLGGAQVNTSLGNENGFLGGIGLEYRVTDQFSVGGEFLSHRFEDVGANDLDANTISLRGTFRF
jgi:outer membrane autotransporter protein